MTLDFFGVDDPACRPSRFAWSSILLFTRYAQLRDLRRLAGATARQNLGTSSTRFRPSRPQIRPGGVDSFIGAGTLCDFKSASGRGACATVGGWWSFLGKLSLMFVIPKRPAVELERISDA